MAAALIILVPSLMIRSDPYHALDFQAPIIIVGAGRSGTTLLDAVIEAHPKVYSIGETSFLLHRLWETLDERKSFYARIPQRLGRHAIARGASVTLSAFGAANFAGVFRRIAHGSYLHRVVLGWKDIAFVRMATVPFGNYAVALQAAIDAEALRQPRELAASFVRLMIPPPLILPRWQFREIWVGSPAFPYDYNLLRTVFPRARYVHCLRHPIDYLESSTKLAGTVLDDDKAVYELKAWVSMVRSARALAETDSFFEIRYEDLVAEDDNRRRALFRYLELSLHQDCVRRLDTRLVPTEPGVSFSDRATCWIDQTPGLRPIMAELG